MTPPNEQKYPSEAVVCDWYNEWEDHLAQLQLVGEPEECLEYFIARKACDWQRARDAEICEAIKTEFSQELPDESYRVACTHCATAIREGTSRE